MSKTMVLMLFTLLVLSGFVMIDSVFAQSISTPSVPEFTVAFADISLKIKIKNQPFVPYYDYSRDWDVEFYFNIRVKLHSSDKWVGLYRAEDGYPGQSDSEYTILTLGHVAQNGLSVWSQNREVLEVSSGDQVDFQVEAMTGHLARAGGPPFFDYEIVGDYSGWSETQTLTVPEIQTPSPEPVFSMEPALILGVATFVAAFAVLLLYFIHVRRGTQS